MLKRFRRGLESWGHYLLALLCAGVILLSAAWTREQRTVEEAGQQALSDQSQRLSEAMPQEKEKYTKPTDGVILRMFSEETVYFPSVRAWQTHRAVDFSAADGEPVRAMLEGTVISCADGCVRLRHHDGMESLYRGLKQIDVSPGQFLRQGALLGRAGARVPYEGAGHICITLMKDGVPLPFETDE